jgi:ubiquinone/menaquinone biosynthesis C-methylase UbiE
MRSKKGKKLQDTGERMIPEFHKGQPLWGLVYAEHVTRYMSAQEIVKDKIVLDIACGSGYGAQILAKSAKRVYGVDTDSDAVDYAIKNYAAKNIEYMVGDAVQIPLEDNSVDVVVTFETIEHINDHQRFLREIKRVLAKGGLAIISTPNDTEFAEGNHFHVHEFVYEELVSVVKKHFKYVEPYFQSTWKSVMVSPARLMEKEGAIDVPVVNMAPLKPEEYLYFYLICSDSPAPRKVSPILALGGHYSDREILASRATYEKRITKAKEEASITEQLSDELQAIKKSRSFKLARKIAKVRHLGR